jgi:hypothetical protein
MMPSSVKRLLRNSASFAIVTLLVLIGMALALESWIFTGPNEWVRCGVTGWLELHRHSATWSIEHVHSARLLVEVLLAVIATWALSRLLHGSRKPA